MYNTTVYDQAGTTTFRRSSSALCLNWRQELYCGTNLQNINKYLRKIYHARKGYKLGQVDQAGAEALIVSYLCLNGNFRSLFLNSVKPHVFVGLHIFSDVWSYKINQNQLDIKFDIDDLLNCKIPDLKKHERWKEIDELIKSSDNWPASERYYYMAKQICHSCNYGIGPRTFGINVLDKSDGKVVIPTKKAREYIEFYHALFPDIRDWHRDIERQIKETRTLYNLFGYPWYFHKEITMTSLQECFAFIPQSTVGCITAIALTRLQEFIEDNNLQWNILADTHDSYLVEAPENEITDCVKIMRGFMEQPLTSPRGEPFNMRAECQIGYNWSPYKKDENEEGMREVKI